MQISILCKKNFQISTKFPFRNGFETLTFMICCNASINNTLVGQKVGQLTDGHFDDLSQQGLPSYFIVAANNTNHL